MLCGGRAEFDGQAIGVGKVRGRLGPAIMKEETGMQIIVELPDDIARQLGGDQPQLSRTALEALAVEGVRSGKLSPGQVRRLLGFSTRTQVDDFLKAHSVFLPLTVEDVERDAETSRRFREQWLLSPTPRH